MIEDILAGYSSKASPYTIYINYLLSYPLMLFFKLSPNINWYAILLLFFQFISFTIIGKNILKHFNKKCGITLYVGICMLFYIPLLFKVSYTSIAGLLIVAAITEQLYMLQNTKNKFSMKNIFIVGFLLLNSFLLRSNTIILYLVFLTIIFVYCILNKINKIKQLFIYNILFLFLILIICIFNNCIYNSNEYYIPFKEHNKYRSILQDFIQLNYANDKDILKEVGLNENDINLFNSFCNSDENVYSTENLKKLYELKIEKNSILSLFDYSFLESLKILFQSWLSYYLFMIIILFVITFTNIKNNKVTNILLFSTTILFHFFFIAINKSVYRVNITLYLYSIVTLIIINSKNINYKLDKLKKYNIIFFTLFIILVFFCNTLLHYSYNRQKQNLAKKLYLELFNYTTSNKDDIYIASTQTLQYRHYAFNILNNKNKYIFNNIKLLGSWDHLDERYINFKENYNIDSLYSALIQKDNCYIIVRNSDSVYLTNIINFLNDHYTNKEINYYETKNINNTISIYKLYTLD